jgi:hypothetical protein
VIGIALRRSSPAELFELLTSNIGQAENMGRLAAWRCWKLINARRDTHAYRPVVDASHRPRPPVRVHVPARTVAVDEVGAAHAALMARKAAAADATATTRTAALAQMRGHLTARPVAAAPLQRTPAERARIEAQARARADQDGGRVPLAERLARILAACAEQPWNAEPPHAGDRA